MTYTDTLTIRDLCVRSGGKAILRDIDMTLGPGEVHVLLGRNGVGKSTLAYTIVGKPSYEVTRGSIRLGDADLLSMSAEERAQGGVFMACQQPVELPGVSNMEFLKTMIAERHAAQHLPKPKATDALKMIKASLSAMRWEIRFLGRGVHHNMSGGEKRRSELLQMDIFKPKVAILDETDSGLDVAGRALMVSMIEKHRDRGTAFLMITHYRELLEALQPDKIHVLTAEGMVSGDAALAQQFLSDTPD